METLDELTAKIDQLFSQSALGFIISSTAGDVFWLNPQMSQLLNQPLKNCTGKKLNELLALFHNGNQLDANQLPYQLTQKNNLPVSQALSVDFGTGIQLIEFTSMEHHTDADNRVIISSLRCITDFDYADKLLLLKNCSPNVFRFENKLREFATQKEQFLAVYTVEVKMPVSKAISHFLARDIFTHLHTIYPIHDFIGWIDTHKIGYINPIINTKKVAIEHETHLAHYLSLFYRRANYDLSEIVKINCLAQTINDFPSFINHL